VSHGRGGATVGKSMVTEHNRKTADEAVKRGLLTPEQVTRSQRMAAAHGYASLMDAAVEARYIARADAVDLEQEFLSSDTPRQLGRYRIVRELGKGGMGAVYKAYDPELDRHVAIKTIIPLLCASKTFVARFRREARLAARLQSPHTVRVFDVGQEGDINYIVMEFVEGESLEKPLRRVGKLDERRAFAVCADVVRALQEAREHNIIHRDIKPQNIMIDRKGVVRLADLGVAKELTAPENGDSGQDLSVAMGVMGTPAYMSPEQAMGKSLDFRSDVFSLGSTLYRMVCGLVPYQGETNQIVMMKVANDPPPDPLRANPSLSPGAAAVIRKMMAKTRQHRYLSLEAFLKDLENVANARPPSLSVGASVAFLQETPARAEAGATPADQDHRRTDYEKAMAQAGHFVEVARARAGEAARSAWEKARAAYRLAQDVARSLADKPTGYAELGDRIALCERLEQYHDLMVKGRDAEARAGRPGVPDEGKTKEIESALAFYREAKQSAESTQEVDARIARLQSAVERIKAAARARAEEQKQYQATYETRIAEAEQFEKEAKTQTAQRARRTWEKAGAAYQAARQAGENLARTPSGYADLADKIALCEGKARYDGLVAQAEKAEAHARETGAAREWEVAKAAYEAAQHAGESLTKKPAGYSELADHVALCERKAQYHVLLAEAEQAEARTHEAGTLEQTKRHLEAALDGYRKARDFADDGDPVDERLARVQKQIDQVQAAQRAKVDGQEKQRAEFDAKMAEAESFEKTARSATGESARSAWRQARTTYVEAQHLGQRMDTRPARYGAISRLIAEADWRLQTRIPPWAILSPFQIKKSEEAVVPAAIEADLGGGVTLNMVYVPPGRFTMGSEKGADDEKPACPTEITDGFYIGICQVTQGQWKAVMGTEPWKGKTYAKSNPDHAVSYISWNDCQRFLDALNRKDLGTFRLPTEAEWEYACRADSRAEFSFGDDASGLGEYAWYDKNAFNLGENYAHRVGQKKANDWGLYDMHGNVWERCQSLYRPYPYKEHDGRESLAASGSRVSRGGCWLSNSGLCRCAIRLRYAPGYAPIGFRVVRLAKP